MRKQSVGARSRSVRWAAFAAGGLAGLVLVVAVVLGLTGSGNGGHRGGVRVVPQPPPAGPSDSAAWWSPVHGEPLGVASDGDDVAAAALDEVRLLDAEDGRTRWKAAFPGVRRYRPALGGDHVAASSETELIVFDRTDGARTAVVPFSGPGPAAVLRDRAGQPMVIAGSETGVLVAVGPGADTPAWSVSHPGSVTVAPVGEDGLVVASWHQKEGAVVRALDVSSGVVQWEIPLGPMAGAPLIASGAVVISDGEGVHEARIRAIDLETGRDRWQVPLSGWFDDELESAVAGGTVYVLDGMGSVIALDLATGAPRWRTDTGRPLVNGRIVATPSSVVFASYDDELMVLDRATGRLQSAELQPGVPVDLTMAGENLVMALRLGSPSRVEAWPAP